MSDPTHIPVLLDEVTRFLDPQSKERFVDGTVGQGGHAEAILERIGSEGRLLGIDRDARNLEVAQERLKRFGNRVAFVQDTYANADALARAHGWKSADGILLDLGFSSAHIEDASRGFSFQMEGPLDMRYDARQELTAATIVNGWKEDELARLFREYGEEPTARKIAKAIVETRRKQHLVTTQQLVDVITEVVPRRGSASRRIHPATRVFQALRIAVNDELGELELALPKLVELLAPHGRLGIISFHSLEDRVVKQFFAKNDSLKILTKHVIVPTLEEAQRNPRARSAKLRVAERL